MKQLFSIILLAGSLLPLSTIASNGLKEKAELFLTKNSDPEVVATLSDRDAIPLAFRAERMYCYVADNHKVYQLRGGVSNAHWVELDLASSMKIQGPAGSLPYIDATGLLATDMRYLGKAKYDYSGANTLGSGQYVTVNGIGNTINDRSHNNVNAYNAYSDGNYVMMMGERDSALGNNSAIIGDDITLNANYQMAAGKGLVGQTAGEILFGQFNQYNSSSSNQWLGTDRLLTLGNGTGTGNRSNAMVVYKNGDAVFSGNISATNLYTKMQIDSMFVVNGGGGGTGVVQSLSLSGTALNITGGNTVNFAGWDTDASDDFSGNYNDLSNLPTLFSGSYIDLTNKPTLFSGDYNDLINMPSFAGWDTDASDDFSGNFNDLTNTPNFSGWDQNAADDFSGDYNDLLNQPVLFSGSYIDLTNKPKLFSGDYNDLINMPSFAGWDTDASDDFSGNFNDLTNTPNFSGWDQNAADDFSGDYNDLINTPSFAGWDTDASDDFSGNYLDLSNLPDIYLKNQVDSAIAAGLVGAANQNLILNGSQLSITGGNNISFLGWDTDASDDFSGNYNDLANKPKLFSGDYNDLANKPAPFSGNYNDLNNKPSFTGWDKNAADDFSGDYMDLINRPSFIGWDMNAADDFSGDFNDLINQPALFSGSYNDLTSKPDFTGWDTDASDDFSGNFNDLTNTPNFSGWDQNAADDFSGDYNDLLNQPVLFSGNYNDLTNQPALFSGDYNDLLNLPSFAGWDTDASDDFTGNYNDLFNKPALFSGNYNDLINSPTFAGWDTDASDDFNGDYNALTNKPTLFSGDYSDLSNAPSIYTRLQVDSMFVVNGGGGGSGTIQNLSLAGDRLTITGGNFVNFAGWDTDATDDFSGDYNDLANKPKIFDGDYNNLTNTPIFAGWDTNASDDFSGNFGDLSNVPTDFQDGKISWNEVDMKPQVYTQSQVDSIKQNIVDSMITYVDSAVIAQGASELINNRNIGIGDVGKTLYVKTGTRVLTLPAGSNLPFNAHIELRDFGSGTLILDASGITLLDSGGDVISGSTNSIVIKDAAITAIGSNEYKIIGLYQ